MHLGARAGDEWWLQWVQHIGCSTRTGRLQWHLQPGGSTEPLLQQEHLLCQELVLLLQGGRLTGLSLHCRLKQGVLLLQGSNLACLSNSLALDLLLLLLQDSCLLE